MKSDKEIAGSFRDPSGFVFERDGEIFRQVNLAYKENFDFLEKSGLYDLLVKKGLLIPHTTENNTPAPSPDAYKILKPRRIPFISYPYEWSFSQLKDAALLTLRIQEAAMKKGMSLKDASAYNVQFVEGKPILMDTLSFEVYREGAPWVAYRQFCQHFLAPLALMAKKDVRLLQMLRIYIDGIPLDLASSLLPFLTKLDFGILTHIHAQASSQAHFADKGVDFKKTAKMSKMSFLAIIDSLKSAVQKLALPAIKTEWGDYYNDTNYSADAFSQKKEIVASFIEKIKPETVWDLGGNVGEFSRVVVNTKFSRHSDRSEESRESEPETPSEQNGNQYERVAQVICFDIDPLAVEKNYLEIRKSLGKKKERNAVEKKEKDADADCEKRILPLVLDLTNPSPGIGWENRERLPIGDRGPCDCAMALALVHHLAISNNLPFSRIAKYFSRICKNLIIEFVPKTDSQVQRLLATREDVFPNYNIKHFEEEFGKYFEIKETSPVKGSERVVHWMTGK